MRFSLRTPHVSSIHRSSEGRRRLDRRVNTKEIRPKVEQELTQNDLLEWIYMEPGVCRWNNVTRKLTQNMYIN